MPERTYSFIGTRLPMPLVSAAAEPGKLDEAVAHIAAHDVELGRIARAEAHYFRGQPEEAHANAAPFLDHSDPALRISANFICAYADLTLGKIWETRECLTNIAAMRNDESIKATPALHASYMLFNAASSVLLHLPAPYPPDTFANHIAALPEGLRLFGIYALAHHAYLFGEYGRCVGMAETALMTKQGRYPIAEQFLHLVAAMGQVNLRDAEAARNSRNTCCNSKRKCHDLMEFKQPNRQSAPRSHHRIPHLSCCSAQANRRHLARIGTYKHSSAWIPPPLGPLRSKPPRSICARPSPKSHL